MTNDLARPGNPSHPPLTQAARPLASASLALAGPMALGAVIGLRGGVAPMAMASLTLPAVLGGIAAMTIPALYIGSTLAGVAPPAPVAASAVVRAARANGVVLLGLAAPAAFLIATTTGGGGTAIGFLALGAAALASLRVVFAGMFPATPRCVRCNVDHTGDGRFCSACGRALDVDLGARVRVWAVFTAWSVVALALGARLMFDAIHTLHLS